VPYSFFSCRLPLAPLFSWRSSPWVPSSSPLHSPAFCSLTLSLSPFQLLSVFCPVSPGPPPNFPVLPVASQSSSFGLADFFSSLPCPCFLSLPLPPWCSPRRPPPTRAGSFSWPPVLVWHTTPFSGAPSLLHFFCPLGSRWAPPSASRLFDCPGTIPSAQRTRPPPLAAPFDSSLTSSSTGSPALPPSLHPHLTARVCFHCRLALCATSCSTPVFPPALLPSLWPVVLCGLAASPGCLLPFPRPSCVLLHRPLFVRSGKESLL